MVKVVYWFILLIFAWQLMGCAQKQYRFEYANAQADIVWPKAPETPRYRFKGYLVGENNFIVNPDSINFFHKSLDWLGDLVFGEETPVGLYRPQGGFFDSKNNRLYVTDIGKKAVFVFDFKNKQFDTWEFADEFEKFASPIGIAVNGQGHVFVSDSVLGYVAQLDSEGNLIAKWGEKILQRPTGLAYDPIAKNLFVSDSGQHQIFVFNADGELAFKIGGKKSGNRGFFNSPTYLAINDKKLIVSDTLNARVQIFNLKGKWLASFGKRGTFVGNLPRPKGVATDSENHIYVVESYYNHLLVYDENGISLLPIGGGGRAAGEFDLPAGVWVDNQDRVYVADMFNSRISVFQYLKSTQ